MDDDDEEDMEDMEADEVDSLPDLISQDEAWEMEMLTNRGNRLPEVDLAEVAIRGLRAEPEHRWISTDAAEETWEWANVLYATRWGILLAIALVVLVRSAEALFGEYFLG